MLSAAQCSRHASALSAECSQIFMFHRLMQSAASTVCGVVITARTSGKRAAQAVLTKPANGQREECQVRNETVKKNRRDGPQPPAKTQERISRSQEKRIPDVVWILYIDVFYLQDTVVV